MYIFVVVSNWFFVLILLIKDSFCSIQGIQLVDMYLDNNGDQHKKICIIYAVLVILMIAIKVFLVCSDNNLPLTVFFGLYIVQKSN